MISEKELGDYFDSFWEEHFPLLNATFVRRFNVEHKERLQTKWGSAVQAIPMAANVDRFDLVAEMAFELASEVYRERQGEIPDMTGAITRASNRIALLKGVPKILPPTSEETDEANALLRNYEYFFDAFVYAKDIEFRPRIKGFGILREMEADFCSSDILFEVKAVNRNLQSSDLRQVLCYLVAGIGSQKYSWSRYCIFNPRLAVYYIGRVDELLSYLSGRFAPECISDILSALTEREQPIEARF